MDIDREKEINELIKKAEELPPLPQVAHKALSLLSDPEFNMRELADTLSVDQAMTSTLLHWANSSYYGLRYPVSTVHQAVAYLGEITVRSLVLTVSLSSYMNRPIPGYFLDRGELWKHSVGVAIAAKLVTKKIGYQISEEAYTAGLLCDIGKLAFDITLRKLDNIKPEWEQKTFAELESELFGIDHAKLGAEITRYWGFPESLQDAIAYHHEPSKAEPDAILPASVHIGDSIVSMLGIGLGRDALQYRIDFSALERLCLHKNDMENLVEQVASLIIDAENMLNPS